jgi:effector-binding domain-containing protein
MVLARSKRMGSHETSWMRWGAAILLVACGTGSPPPQTPAPDASQPAAPSVPSDATEDATDVTPAIYQVETKTVEAQTVLQIHLEVAPTDLGARYAEAFEALYPYAVEQGATVAGAPYGCYHEFTAERVVVDIGVPLSRTVPPSGEMQPGQLPAGEIAFATHRGSYQHVQRAHEAVKRWLQGHGRQASGAPCEIYEVGPGQVPDEKDYRTRIVYWLEG